MDESSGHTLLLTQSAVASPPLTRKGNAKANARSLPGAKPGAHPSSTINATPRGAPSSFSFFEITSDEQPVIHDGSDEVRQTQQEHLSAEAPSAQTKRRGRPRKASSAQNKKKTEKEKEIPTVSKTVDRRPSASSIDSSRSAQTDNPPSNSEKKTRLRARNREAAHKCRVRKQRGIGDLQTQEAAIGAVNKSLKDQYAELRCEVLLLKDMVLQHGGCGCSFIESYIEDAAASLTQNPDSFMTSHAFSSNFISPSASWSPTTPQVPGSPGFPSFEDETSSPAHFDWKMTGGSMKTHEGGQMEDMLTGHNGLYKGLEVQDHVAWMGYPPGVQWR